VAHREAVEERGKKRREVRGVEILNAAARGRELGLI